MSGTLSVAGAEYTKNLQGKKRKVTFECQSCTRKFATRSHLVRHSRVHTGERRYACDYPGCEMRCSRKDNLQQHYRTHLVVNPRRANAQAILNGPSHDFDPDRTDSVAHDFNADNTKQQQQLTSPTDLKPIIIAGNAISQSANPSSVQVVPETRPLPINSNTHPGLAAGQPGDTNPNINGAEGPERDWSISPPPPLSSADDYWYAHGCLPQAARNPASVSGSGSSGATSPEISNALELAPGQVPRGGGAPYVDSPATYYHPHPPPPPLGSSLTSTGYSGYDAHGQEGGSANITGGRYPLATATFPTAAEYQHAAPSHHHHHTHPHHGRSHSHSYSVGHTGSIGAAANNGGYTRLGYQSATTSPHISHAHLHHHSNPNAPRYSTTGAESYEASPTSATASYANNRSLAGVGYAAASGPASSPTTERYPTSTYHTPHHSHSHSGSFSMPRPLQPQQQQQQQPQQPREGDSRPVTRNGSMSSGYSMPVYPSHPAQMAYGVPVDMNHPQTYNESPIQRHPSMPVSVSNSPRMATSTAAAAMGQQQSPSVVLPPIRYADNEMGVAQHQQYGTMMGHFGGSWDRVNVSDARALPPQGHAMTR